MPFHALLTLYVIVLVCWRIACPLCFIKSGFVIANILAIALIYIIWKLIRPSYKRMPGANYLSKFVIHHRAPGFGNKLWIHFSGAGSCASKGVNTMVSCGLSRVFDDMDVLTYDNTGCGHSQVDLHIGIGTLAKDAIHMMHYVLTMYSARDIYVSGHSFGAIKALQFCRTCCECGHVLGGMLLLNPLFDAHTLPSPIIPFRCARAMLPALCQAKCFLQGVVLSGAMVILCTEQDEVVPPQQAVELFKAYQGEKKHIELLQGSHTRPEIMPGKALSWRTVLIG